MALQAGQVEPAAESCGIDFRADHLRMTQAFAIAFHPSIHALGIPFDIAVAQQRDEVVSDRAGHRVLEIYDARTQESGRNNTWAQEPRRYDARAVRVDDQQVAAVEIAVHEAARLLQYHLHDERECCFDDIPFVATGREAEVAPEKPFRHAFQFADQQRAVVGGQARAIDLGLHPHERVERVRIQRIRGRVVQLGQVGARAEILHQHEALRAIDREYLRCVQPGAVQPRADVEPRLEVLLVWWRVHQDVRGGSAGRCDARGCRRRKKHRAFRRSHESPCADSPVTAEARIDRCGFDRKLFVGECRGGEAA